MLRSLRIAAGLVALTCALTIYAFPHDDAAKQDASSTLDASTVLPELMPKSNQHALGKVSSSAPTELAAEAPVSIAHGNNFHDSSDGPSTPVSGECGHAPGKTTTLLLQVFLGPMGVAYGYIDRWGLFTAAFVPNLVLVCSKLAFDVLYQDILREEGQRGQDDERKSAMALGLSCWICLFSIWVLAFWIWGIVKIADNELPDGNGCALLR